MATVNWSLQHFTDTAANFTANNPTLLAGQLGIETDGLTTTPKFKIGDGTSTWTALPYAGGGSLSTVLGVGNTTSGQDIVLTDDDKLQIGSTAGRYIGYDTNLIQIGLGIINTNSNDHIVLQDGGGIHVDTSFVELPHLTASRVIATDANNRLSALTGTGILTLTGGAISYDTNTYLTTSAAALAYQPLDADLTSWASVTRATGFDTFTATPSSANLSSLLTDKTGTGVNVFGTSPTFTTDITTPLIIGGSAVGSTIQYKGTSGNGTSTVAAHKFLVGNNGATTAAQIFNSGQVSIGNYASPNNQRLVTIGQDTGYVSIGSRVGTTSHGAIYFSAASPSDGSSFISGSTSLLLSGGNGFNICVGGNPAISANSFQELTFSNLARSSGATTAFTWTKANSTGQTASTPINGFLFTTGTRQWATGAITTQKEFEVTSPTYSFVGASTITNAYTVYFNSPTAGTNATITNNWAIGATGGIKVNATANTVLGNAALATNATTGFLHVPSCAGTPTGTPTLYTGMIPVCADSTNNKLYIYSGGAWVALN